MFSTSSLNGYERDNEDEDTENDNYNQNQKREFKIEEPPDINLDELFI